jgi:outer membrane protein assembly factor BamB
MVGLSNKNGVYYAFDRDDLSAGPVWSLEVSDLSSDIPVAASAYDGTDIYIMGGQATIDGTTCSQSLYRVDPDSGTIIWQTCTAGGPALGDVAMAPGVILIGSHTDVQVYSAAKGKLLYSFTDPSSSSLFWGAGSIADGMIFFGNKDGNLYAFKPPASSGLGG